MRPMSAFISNPGERSAFCPPQFWGGDVMLRFDILEGSEPYSLILISSGGKENRKDDAIYALPRATAGRSDC